jgi:hypothetical protein
VAEAPLCAFGSRKKASSPDYFLYDDAQVALKFGSLAGWLTTWAMGLPATPQNTHDL